MSRGGAQVAGGCRRGRVEAVARCRGGDVRGRRRGRSESALWCSAADVPRPGGPPAASCRGRAACPSRRRRCLRSSARRPYRAASRCPDRRSFLVRRGPTRRADPEHPSRAYDARAHRATRGTPSASGARAAAAGWLGSPTLTAWLNTRRPHPPSWAGWSAQAQVEACVLSA
jgi:hypothetical protein